jgi:hypothetical protein
VGHRFVRERSGTVYILGDSLPFLWHTFDIPNCVGTSHVNVKQNQIRAKFCSKDIANGYHPVPLLNYTPTFALQLRKSTCKYHTNQPNRKGSKDGVKGRRETSSLARLHNSCVQNALLEMVNGALNCGGGGGDVLMVTGL